MGHPILWDLTISVAAELAGSVPLILQFTFCLGFDFFRVFL